MNIQATNSTGASSRPLSREPALWVIALLLAFIAGWLVGGGSSGADRLAIAQTAGPAGARGVYAFPGQLDSGKFGLFMLDVDEGTLWCYELENVGGVRKLRLIAGRSWIYDRYLKNFNNAGETWQAIRDLVAEERGRAAGETAPIEPAPSDPAVSREPRN